MSKVTFPTPHILATWFNSLNISIALIVFGFALTVPLVWAADYSENNRIGSRESRVEAVESGSPQFVKQAGD